MKKIIKTLALLTLVLCTVFLQLTVPVTAAAAGNARAGIAYYDVDTDSTTLRPKFNNVTIISLGSSISSDGTLDLLVRYIGNPRYTTNSKSVIRVFKRAANGSWIRVPIPYTVTNEYVLYSNNWQAMFCRELKLSGRGTYKVSFDITIYGTNGSPDRLCKTYIEYY